MIKAIVFTGLAAVAVAQYPQQQAAAPQGAPYSFSSSVNHAAAPAAGAQQSYAAPQSYGAPPAPAAGGYNPGSYQQYGAHSAGASAGLGNIQQIAAQNPAFSIQVPQGHEQSALAGAPQPPPGAYAAPQQYGAPQQYAAPQSYGAPQAAGAGNPYGGPFQYSSSVSHSVPQAQPQAAAGPPAHAG